MYKAIIYIIPDSGKLYKVRIHKRKHVLMHPIVIRKSLYNV